MFVFVLLALHAFLVSSALLSASCKCFHGASGTCNFSARLLFCALGPSDALSQLAGTVLEPLGLLLKLLSASWCLLGAFGSLFRPLGRLLGLLLGPLGCLLGAFCLPYLSHRPRSDLENRCANPPFFFFHPLSHFNFTQLHATYLGPSWPQLALQKASS